MKELFKVKDNELTFFHAVEIAFETEDVAKVAKETIHGSKSTQSFHKVRANKFSKKSASNSKNSDQYLVKCFRCDKTNHVAIDCCFKYAVYYRSLRKGLSQEGATMYYCTSPVKAIDEQEINSIAYGIISFPKLQVVIAVKDTKVAVELDIVTAAISLQEWQRLGKPHICKTLCKFQSASELKSPVSVSFEGFTVVPVIVQLTLFLSWQRFRV